MNDEALALTEELSNAYEELSLLYEMGDALSSLSPDDILSRSVEKAFEFIRPDVCAAFLLSGQTLKPFASKSRNGAEPLTNFSARGGKGVLGNVAKTGKALLVNEERHLSAAEKKAGWKKILAAPLSGENATYGVLSVMACAEEPSFFSQQKKLLSALSRQAGLSLENAYLFENLKKENAVVEAILTNVTDAVFAFNEGLQCVHASGEACRLIHLEKDSVQGKNAKEIFKGADGMKVLRFLRAFPLMQPVQKEFTLSLDGDLEQFRAGGLTLADSNGKPYLKILVLHNITEVVRTQKIMAWQDIARKLAHELKNPLTPIRLNAEALQDEDLQNAPNFKPLLMKFTDVIIKEVDRLKNLVDEFHNFGRLPQPRLEDVDMHTFLKDVLDLYRFSDNIKFIWKPDDSHEPVVFADPNQLKQVFINLVKNAMEAMPQGGEITLTVRAEGKKVSVEVKDTGSGMPKEILEHIFDPYYTTKKTGTGLGLSLVHRIVTDHKGEIKVSSKPKQGTLFTVRLPLKER